MDREKITKGLEVRIISDTDKGYKTIEIPVNEAENIVALLKEQEKMLKEQEVRLLTEKEATAWCEDYNKETVRTKPIVEEYLRPFDKAHWFEWITPDDDYFTADIVGYNEQVRLWTGMPTEEQWKAEKWKT